MPALGVPGAAALAQDAASGGQVEAPGLGHELPASRALLHATQLPAPDEPGGGLAFGMNKSWYEGLTDWEKAIIEAACMEEHAASHEENIAKNGEYLGKLVNEHGVQVRAFNDDVWDAFGVAAAEVFADVRAHSDLALRIDDHFQAALRSYGSMLAAFEGTFINQRNRVLGLI